MGEGQNAFQHRGHFAGHLTRQLDGSGLFLGGFRVIVRQGVSHRARAAGNCQAEHRIAGSQLLSMLPRRLVNRLIATAPIDYQIDFALTDFPVEMPEHGDARSDCLIG